MRTLLLPFSLLLLSLLLVLLPDVTALAGSASDTITAQLSSLCDACQVLLLGERHRQPESPALFVNIVRYFLTHGERVLVGLEIPAAKQSALDAVLAGQHPPAGLAHPLIDSEFYRAMLREFAQLQQRNPARMKVVAIDGKTERDRTMTRHLIQHLAEGYDRVVVLVGNFHALQAIDWAEEVTAQTLFLAERLVVAGVQVTSVVQDMDTPCPHPRQPVFSPVTAERGLAAVHRILEPLDIAPAMDLSRVADGVVIWECIE